MISLTLGPQSGDIDRHRKQNGSLQGVGKEGNGELVCNGYQIPVREDEKVLGDGWW